MDFSELPQNGKARETAGLFSVSDLLILGCQIMQQC